MKNIFFIALFLSYFPVFAQKTYNTGLDLDDAAYTQIPVKKAELQRNYETMPSKADLKPYCPMPQRQADKQTCVGWAIGYAACTITEGVAKNVTDKTQLQTMATSPDFVYAFGKKMTDKECAKGIVMDETLKKLYGQVIPRMKNFNMICTNTSLPTAKGKGVKIMQHTRLFKNEDTWDFKLAQIKNVLANKKPVVVGIECSKSFFDTKEVWDGNNTDFRGGHALCMIGYDDNFQNGAVEVMNSWGAEWGKNGFGWIKYSDLQAILKYAYEINTDCFDAEQNTSTQIAKNPELTTKISLKLANGTEMPLILNPAADKRGLKPVKEKENSSVSDVPKPVLKEVAQYKTVQSYTSGTRYRVYLDISQPTYLYVLGSDLTGQVAALFPPDETISPYLSNKNTAIALPDEQWFIEMDDTKGKDFMLFLYSTTPLSISALIGELNTEKGSFLEKISKKFGQKIAFIDAQNLDTHAIQVQTFQKPDKIQAISLEIEHQ